MKTSSIFVRTALAVLVLAALGGCGGGGDDPAADAPAVVDAAAPLDSLGNSPTPAAPAFRDIADALRAASKAGGSAQ